MRNNSRRTFKLYWSYAMRYKLSFLIIVFSIAIGSVTQVVAPLFYKQFFDILASEGTKEIVASELIDILKIILMVHFAGWLGWRASEFMMAHFYTRTVADVYNACFKNLHKHSFSFFNNNFVGSLTKRVGYFVNSFRDILDKMLWDFFPLIIRITIIIAVLLWKNYILGIIIIIWLIIYLAINWFMTLYKMKYDIRRSKSETRVSGFLADTIANNANVKLFCGYGREVKSFFDLNEKVRKISKFTYNLENIFEAIQVIFVIALEIGVFYMGVKLWEKGVFTVGDFILLQSYVLIIFHNVFNFGKLMRRAYQNFADAEEMTEIFNTPFEIKDAPKAKKLKAKEGKIEFADVVFYYNKTRKVLNNFSLVINSHERVALIGPSGAGKTTAIKLLLRNHDVSAGKILIDGQDIAKVTQESLWENVSLVPQDPILFHRTLMENIRYGKFNATDEEVIEASKMAHCHEFISELSEEYNTYVGERGIKLSGGERQRVAIARSILRNSPILILDEATSSLDSHSESLIQDALGKLMKNKTVIVIAHRLSTIVKMDRIIYIDEGKIIEEGTHEQLLRKSNGQYKKIWELQAGGFITD